MILNHRVLVPSDPRSLGAIANGRRYPATPGTVISVPESDARVLEANGWIYIVESGPTSARPSNINARVRGALFFDETLGLFIVFGGSAWRDATTGAVV
jgi:hypothetical protein